MKKIMMTVFMFLMVIVFSGVVSADELDHIENVLQQNSIQMGTLDNWRAAASEDRLSGDILDYLVLNVSVDQAQGAGGQKDNVLIVVSSQKGMYFISNVGFEPVSLFEDISNIRVKFDDGDIIEYKGKTNVDYLYIGNEFMEKMKNSKTMMLEFKPMFGDSREVVSFEIDGFDEAYEWLNE